MIESLRNYTSPYKEEQFFVERFLALLKQENCFQRTHLPGHITGSVWIVDEARTHVLLTHHARLNRWLQPGGHSDGDEDALAVALREADEETGLKKLNVLHAGIFDIDIHPIPARADFPAHDHYDIRFLISGDRNEPLIISEESHDLRWIPLNDLDQYNDSGSLRRMKEKAKM